MASRITRKSTSPKLHYRTRKSGAAPQSDTVVVSYVRELPGAVFFGNAINDDESIECRSPAADPPRIRKRRLPGAAVAPSVADGL